MDFHQLKVLTINNGLISIFTLFESNKREYAHKDIYHTSQATFPEVKPTERVGLLIYLVEYYALTVIEKLGITRAICEARWHDFIKYPSHYAIRRIW